MAVGDVEFEAALAGAQSDAESALRSVADVGRELKRARHAAAMGTVRDLRRALATAAELVDELARRVRAARDGYQVDEAELLGGGAYATELLAAAAAAEVSMFAEDDRLLCYPSIVRLMPADAALEVDRRRIRNLRPSVVVEQLGRAQRSGSKFKPGPFLASLAAGYDLVVARQGKEPGVVVRLVDVYGVLTLLPGQSRDYSKAEFARDLYLLDQTGVRRVGTTDRQLRWAASTGTRQAGVLTTVAHTGQQQRYWGVAFSPGAS